MKKYILFLFLFLPFVIKAQIISAFAGGGSGGDGSPAISASIYDPNSLTFDKQGNLYFSQSLSHKIRKIDTAGIITTIAGTGTGGFNGDNQLATAAELYQPNGIAIDTFGNIYIADGINNRIRKIDIATGIITTFAGNGNPGFSGDSGLATAASLHVPSSICFDKRGNLYIGDDVNFRIRKVNTSGIITTVAGTGIAGYVNDSGIATVAQCIPETGICIDYMGNLYIASGNQVVLKMDTTGIITTITGDTSLYMYNGDGILAIQAHLTPSFLAIDSGLLYISDALNNRIRKIDANGIIHTVAGNGLAILGGNGGIADSASFDGPSGIAFDNCGNLYIANVNTPRIRKVTFDTSCHLSSVDTNLKINTISSNSSINIYPNPANKIITVTSTNKINNVAIINMLGQTLYNREYNNDKIEVDISKYASGVYYLQITDISGSKEVKKIVKQ